jgi:hypothetical protein
MKMLNIFRPMVLPVAMLGLLGSAAPLPPLPLSSPGVNHTSTNIVGDYVEARTASVFAGACHYNGELVTTGHDAVMAWKIGSGSWKGTDLSGVCAMGAVSSEDNLKNDAATRQSEIVVDSSASAAQTTALADFLAKECGSALGKIISVREGKVLFDHTGSTYTVKSAGFAEMTVQSMPNDECCKQPNLVWYSPLMALEHRKVGYTINSSYEAGTVGDPWQRSEENTAFYGAFVEQVGG